MVEMKWENKGHEFDALRVRLKNIDTKYYIWGAGTFGIAFFEEFCEEIPIVAFVDRNKEKWGRKLCGLKILSPEEFLQGRKDEIVIVSTGMTKSAYDQLRQMGLVRHKDFFHIDEISSIYMLDKYNKVYVSDLMLSITQCCTLRCEYCNAFMPQISNPVNYDMKFIQDEIDLYFRWVDEVNILGLVGGDAMAHPRFNELLSWIGEKYYPHKVKHLEIYSNAVIEPGKETLKMFERYDVFYRFTDYSGNSGRQNIEKITMILDEHHIRYDHAKFEDWFDSGYPQLSNGITSEDGLKKFFELCDRKSCHGLWGNKLLFCGMCLNADLIDYCKLKETDYFDLGNYDASKRIELLEYYLGYNERGYMEYCKMCNGGINVNTHKIEVGKQMKI